MFSFSRVFQNDYVELHFEISKQDLLTLFNGSALFNGSVVNKAFTSHTHTYRSYQNAIF